MTNFTQWELPDALLESLERMGITVPTSIQQETIPLALKGLDILASAQTGTGKTVAYLIPLIQKLTKNPQEPGVDFNPDSGIGHAGPPNPQTNDRS